MNAFTPTATSGGHREAHLVEDVGKGQRAVGVRADAVDWGTLRADRRELVPDATLVDDCESIYTGAVVVIVSDREIVESLRKIFYGVLNIGDHPQLSAEVDLLF